MRFISLVLMLNIIGAHGSLLAQTATPSPSPAAVVVPVAAPAPFAFGLQDGTPLKLRINRNMSSADAKTGETVDFEVLEDIKIGDVIIIPKGGTALGTVTRGKPKGRLGKGGKLDINIDSVRAVSGDKIALRAVRSKQGTNTTGAMTGAMIASGILFFPVAPLFLFLKGKEVKILKGTEITAYVNGDTPLDPTRFVPGAAAGMMAAVIGTSTITVKSDPDGADITIDGKFVGNAPSTLQLGPGDHIITVTKAGYAAWEKTITATAGGNVNVTATLLRP